MCIMEWSSDVCSPDFDIDGALYDVRDDDSQTWKARALAGASIGIDAIAGFRAVLELCEAMNRIVRGEDDGKRRLAEILGRDGDDYQRCLWYSVAGRDPLAVATCFSELEKLLAARASLWVETSRRGLATSKTDNPYWTSSPEGPRAKVDAQFGLGGRKRRGG